MTSPNAVLSSRLFPLSYRTPLLSFRAFPAVIPNALTVIPNGVRNLRSPSDGLPLLRRAFG